MGTKTVDETVTEDRADAENADVTKAAEAEHEAEAVDGGEHEEVAAEATEAGPSGVGQGAGAIVSAVLALVSLSGGWLGTIAAERQSVHAQLESSLAQSQDVAKMLQQGYGDAWNATALWAGAFALAALIVGVVVLARPAFGAPGKPQAAWIKSVAWGGVSLGVIGLLLAVLKYTDVLLGVPSVG
ncbi:hypothetical protein ACHBTE_29605 [Streptomyces sp. M41]|uniref:hypothetical protein n=1 Tax=Streptomyces sp. M41 TaxID=3059412 RepID=UPI00374CF572